MKSKKKKKKKKKDDENGCVSITYRSFINSLKGTYYTCVHV